MKFLHTSVQLWRQLSRTGLCTCSTKRSNFMSSSFKSCFREAVERVVLASCSTTTTFKGEKPAISTVILQSHLLEEVGKAFQEREHKAPFAAPLFANRVVLIQFYNQRNEAERPHLTCVRSGSSWTGRTKPLPHPMACCLQLTPPFG